MSTVAQLTIFVKLKVATIATKVHAQSRSTIFPFKHLDALRSLCPNKSGFHDFILGHFNYLLFYFLYYITFPEKVNAILKIFLDALRLKSHKTHPGGTAHRDDFFQFNQLFLQWFLPV